MGLILTKQVNVVVVIETASFGVVLYVESFFFFPSSRVRVWNASIYKLVDFFLISMYRYTLFILRYKLVGL